MKDCFVIFDTNAYRCFVEDMPLKEIKSNIHIMCKKQDDTNIVALMSPIVVNELLSHLADKADPHFNTCKKAIIAQYQHCGDENNFKLIADPDMIICRMLFNYDIPGRVKQLKYHMRIAYEIWSDEGQASITKHKNSLIKIKHEVDSQEQQFINDMLNMIQSFDNHAVGFRIYKNDSKRRGKFLKYIKTTKFDVEVANMYFIKALSYLLEHNKQINNIDSLEPYHAIIIKIFIASIDLYRELWKRIAETGCDLTKNGRGNYIWDIHLLFTVGDETVNNKKIYFVTNDGAMSDASKSAGFGANVLKLQDYLNIIGYNNK